MSQAYVKPGVSVDELINPTFQPLLGEPTSICLIGPARGFDSKVEQVQLLDEISVGLSVPDGIDLSSVTVTSLDGQTTYARGTATGGSGSTAGRSSADYYILGNEIVRSMQTNIESGQTVVVYYEVDPNGSGAQPFTDVVTFTSLVDPSIRSGVGSAIQLSTLGNLIGTKIQALSVQSVGIIPDSNYSVTFHTGVTHCTIAALDTGFFVTNIEGIGEQTVYVDFTTVNGVRSNDNAVALNGTTAVNLPGTQTGGDGPNQDPSVANIIVKNQPGILSATAIRYASTPDSAGMATPDSSADFTLIAANNGNSHAVYSIYRPSGTSTIGDGDTVSVVYDATPSDYYLPTRCFSQSDVEDKYGPALDSNGNVTSPVSLAASLTFANGATDVVVLALFREIGGVRTTGGIQTLNGDNLADWASTLEALRDIEDVNVLVPIVSAVGTGPFDALNRSIFQAVQDHIKYMIQQQDQYLVAICGEDSTQDATSGGLNELQGTAQILGARVFGETMVLVSPSAYTFANPTTGANSPIGGQYVAACVAGRLASQAIQTTLTRKQIVGLTGVTDFRSEAQKDTDASKGLFVVENKGGLIRVRHAITTAVNDPNTRELSVIRAKHYMIENVKATIDNQVIGQIVADERAAFSVQLLVTNTLDSMVTEGAIVSYQNVQARLLTTDPTAVEVRFSYLPAFPLNYVNIVFSINTASGVVTTDTSQGL